MYNFVMKSCVYLHFPLVCLVLLQGCLALKITSEKSDSPLVGCDASLIWRLDKQDYKTSITKQNQQLQNNEKYRIHETHDSKTILTIRNVTLEDAGFYRCQIDSTKEYTDINLSISDFQWKTKIDTKTVVVGDGVSIIWKYQLDGNIPHRIRIYRHNGVMQDLFVWENDDETTIKSKIRMSVQRTKGEDGTFTLNLMVNYTVMVDLIYIYMVQLEFKDGCSKNSEPVSLTEKQLIFPDTPIMESLPQEDVTFVWRYRYTYPALMVFLTRMKATNPKVDSIGYWHAEEFVSSLDNDTNRLTLNITERHVASDIEGQITVKLRNASTGDFNYGYKCRIIFPNQHQSSNIIILKVLEKQTRTEKRRTKTDDSRLHNGEVAAIILWVLFIVAVVVAAVVMWRNREKLRNCIKQRKKAEDKNGSSIPLKTLQQNAESNNEV
ncbi:uncharacterized protein LOC126818039 [Patella vulgata]|uniref:uncharacterized protein LOC126818039 n=1 Tax=Patella vulgata TaxID=6465 RepID=UPI00217F415F|nr:uncharacterized protein LOC126818039 [Patella vulgata]